MGKTRYKAILEALRDLSGKTVHLNIIKMRIKKTIATKDPAVVEILHNMEDFGFIKELSAFKYKIVIPENE